MSNKSNTMNILLTNRELVNIQGSELVTVELAEYFTEQGHDVLVYSPYIGGGALDVSHLNTTSEKPKTDDFDLLWIHHNQLIHDLGFRKRKGQRMVFNHMSSYVPLEWPKLARYEVELADIILANSAETRAKLELFGLKDIHLLQNPAPKAFESVERGSKGGLFISNHRPLELMSAPMLDIPCTFVGLNDEPMRITPEVMDGYSFVVCNGKSTQYAMRAGLPVFLYDHMGGCGWLNRSNMDVAEWHNFSGRGFKYPANIEDLKLWQVQTRLPCESRFKLEVALCSLGLPE